MDWNPPSLLGVLFPAPGLQSEFGQRLHHPPAAQLCGLDLPVAGGGYPLLRPALSGAAEALPSLELLKPFCTALGVCALTQFVPSLDGLIPGWLNLFISILTLYTHFQLLTDLAALAQEALGEGRRVKRLRTARTLIVAAKTALYCYDLVVSLTALAVVLMAVSFCVQVFLLFQLWGLSRDLEKQQSP